MAKYILLVIAFILALPATDALAQVTLSCPADWASDTKVMYDDPMQPAADGWHDFKDFNYSYSYSASEFPLEAGESLGANKTPVSVTFDTNIATAAFTKIYANMSNIIFPFVNASDAEISEYLEGTGDPTDTTSDYYRWLRHYCLDGQVDKGVTQEGTMTLTTKASMTAEALVYVCKPRQTPPAPAGTICIGSDYDAGTNSCPNSPSDALGALCTPQREPRQATRNLPGSKSEDDTFQMPYRLALRDIARKTAYTIKQQYCKVGEANACLHDDYDCIPKGAPIPGGIGGKVVYIPANDPAANGKDGMCFLKIESQRQPIAAQVVQRMCAPVIPNQEVATLSSLMCHYGDLEYTAFTPDVIRVSPRISRASTSDTPSSPDVSKNTLPFDSQLFSDNGEEINPACGSSMSTADCQINGYFRRALNDRLSMYSEEDRGIFDELKYRIQIASDNETPYEVSGSVRGGDDMNYGFGRGYPDAWSFDYVEKLGGYMMMAEEARFFNPELLPAGDRVVMDGENRAYMRGGQVFYNNYVVSNRPRYLSDGTPVSVEQTAFDEFMRLSEVIDLLMDQLRKRMSNPDGEPVFEASPLYACIRFQDAAGFAVDPETNLSFRCSDFALENGMSPAMLTPLKDQRIIDVFELFWFYFGSQEAGDEFGGLIHIVDLCLSGDTGRPGETYQQCVDRTGPYLDTRFEAFIAAYQELRDAYGAQFGNFSPTLHCVHYRCLVTFVNGTHIYAGISEYGRDILKVIQLPIEGETMPQISHRAYLTPSGKIVLIYSQLDSTYKILIYDPTNVTPPRIVDTSVSYLAHLDAVTRVMPGGVNEVVIAFFNENATSLSYRVYNIERILAGTDGMTVGNNFSMGGEPFSYFRPGPGLSIALDNFNQMHVVAPIVEGNPRDYEKFEQSVVYAKVNLASGAVTGLETVTSNALDRTAQRIPTVAGATIFASRIMAFNGRSIIVDVKGNPSIVWINRVTSIPTDVNGVLPTFWEYYTQAFYARKTVAGWSVKPLSDRQPGTVQRDSQAMAVEGGFGEVRNVFITPNSMGMTVNDIVTKRDMTTRMMDAAGAKRCVYTQPSVWLFGSTDCANLTNKEYVRPNRGDWIAIPATRP